MDSIDNFNNDQYFKQYMDLINQPSAADAIGDAFLDQSNQKAYGKKQRLSNSISRGIGAGLKAASNSSKQKQLEPLLEKIGQINAINSTLQVELAEKKQQQFKATQAFEMAAPAYFEWAKAKMAGDEVRSPKLARAVFDNFKNILGMSDFDHEHGGFFYGRDNKTGEIKGVNLVHYASQNGIDLNKMFGPDSNFIKAASSDGAAAEYQNTQELQRQQLAMGQANIDDKRSHTNLQNMQAGEIGRKMNQQPEVISSEDAVTQETINLQKEAIKDIYQSRVSDSFYKSSMKTAEDILKKAQKNSSKYERNLFSRAFDKEGDNIRLNKEQERLHTVGAEIKGAMFKRFKYRNQTEFENLPDISPNKTVQQNIAALQVIQDTYKEMVKGEESAISSFNELIKSQHTSEGSANLTTNQSTSKAPEFVQDENGNIYRIED